jgi:hypothetical protein
MPSPVVSAGMGARSRRPTRSARGLDPGEERHHAWAASGEGGDRINALLQSNIWPFGNQPAPAPSGY